MTRFEYKVVPAPHKGTKAKGLKKSEDRFALALTTILNEQGADGWEYVRTDILPAEERAGLASKQLVYHNMLIFRRPLEEGEQARLEDASEEETPLAIAAPQEEEETVPEEVAEEVEAEEAVEEIETEEDAPRG